jgi:16S rRNA (adenine1518-N6/adenine1519-N6)-dimethyltransferase
VLRVDLAVLLPEVPQKWNVVANLPYNISTEVLFRLYGVHSRLARMTLMLQKEVGDRLAAPPDCSEYGVTTVLLGLWFDISRAFVVHPGSFHPSPKVDSVVLNFIPRSEARAEVGDEDLFRAVVKSAFSMRRKTLYNCLKSAEFAKMIDCGELLEACAIDGRRRGETLSLEEFAVLSRRVTELVRTASVYHDDCYHFSHYIHKSKGVTDYGHSTESGKKTFHNQHKAGNAGQLQRSFGSVGREARK